MNEQINPKISAAKQLVWADKNNFQTKLPLSRESLKRIYEIRDFLKRHPASALIYNQPKEVWDKAIKHEIEFRQKIFAGRDSKVLGFLLAHESQIHPNIKKVLFGEVYTVNEVNRARNIIKAHYKEPTPPSDKPAPGGSANSIFARATIKTQK